MTHFTDTGRVRSASGSRPTVQHEKLDQEIVRRVSGLIRLGVGTLNLLIFMRFMLKLMEANAAHPFAALVNSTTEPFLSMFRGLLPTVFYNGSTIEFYDLIAIVVFGMLGWLMVQLLRVMFGQDE